MSTTATLPHPADAASLDADAFLAHMAGMQAHYAGAGAAPEGPRAQYRLPAAVLALAQGESPHAAPAHAPALHAQAMHAETLHAPAPHAETPHAATPQAGTPAAATAARMAEAMNRLIAVQKDAESVRIAAGFVMLRTQGALTQFIQGRHDAVSRGLAAVPQGSSAGQQARTQQFVAQMNALEARELTDAAARLDAMFHGLVAVGQAHPALRPQILVVSNHAGGFLALVQHDARVVLAGAVHGVGAAGAAVGTAVAGAAHAVEHWAADAAKSVGSFFKGLF